MKWMESYAKRKRSAITLFTGFVSVRGLVEILPALHKLHNSRVPIRLLCGVSQPDDVTILIGLPGVGHEPDLASLLDKADTTLHAEINHIPISRQRGMALLELTSLLKDGAIECRREERRMMHAKGLLLPDTGEAVIGSANLTLSGSRWNREMAACTERTAAPVAQQYLDEWWNEAVPYDLAGIIRRRFVPYRPELIYLTMLYHIFGDEVDHQSQLPLTGWQRDGVAKALQILNRLGGALLCDDVGLGKTDEALAIALHGVEHNWGRVLIVCPANLQQMWTDTFQKWPIPFNVISYDKLVREVIGDRDSGDQRWIDYGLIICDEAHHLRNPERQRVAAVRKVLASQKPRPRILLLTATPVNNSCLDLYELLCLADPNLEKHWAPVNAATSQRSKGRSGPGWRMFAVCRHPLKYAPNDQAMQNFYRELDRRMVRRSRSLITSAYPESATRFPHRDHKPLHYCLTADYRRMLGDVLDALGAGALPDAKRQLRELRGSRRRVQPLTLAAYRTEEYRRSTSAKRVPLAPFIKCMLLKRLESSPAAFASTTQRLANRIEVLLQYLEQGWVLTPGPELGRRLTKAFTTGIMDEELLDSDDDTAADALDRLINQIDDADRQPASDFETDRLQSDLTHDRDSLRWMARAAGRATTDDAKFSVLHDLLRHLARNHPGEKTLILTCSRKTAVDLHAKLETAIEVDPDLTVYKGRTATAAPENPLTKDALLGTLANFVPRTAAGLNGTVRSTPPEDLYDLLIGTDQLGEGHNLQQASILINYDLPWNPQALGQRIGRLDRYDSEHDTVHCFSVLPDTALDLVLKLMSILQDKIAAAASTVGVPIALLPHSIEIPRDYATVLAHLGHIEHPPPLGPYERARTELGNALRIPFIRKAIESVPPGAGAAHPRCPVTPEAVFCFQVETDAGAERTMCHFVQGRRKPTNTTLVDCLNRCEVITDDWLSEADHQLSKLDEKTDTHLFHNLLWTLVDPARTAVAARHRIPPEEALERVQLLTWMAFLPWGNPNDS
ncbi:SNF2-related protein [Saccharopolyspora indica]|uniref:SNF2-related protein n=1 Tax=Saccharopolyspora indica TaxID=1229659 RepID=UPI0022EA75F6|nr:SNF2-related protein [Saccharopolyspora indica]MDA3644326.1 SNF2-related protein [Saccharopolyspora indica]